MLQYWEQGGQKKYKTQETTFQLAHISIGSLEVVLFCMGLACTVEIFLQRLINPDYRLFPQQILIFLSHSQSRLLKNDKEVDDFPVF